MVGYIVAGALGAFVLSRVVRHHHRWHGCGGHYGRHGHGGWRSRRGGGWRRWALYSLFDRLDATPGQEKVIMNAVEDLRGHARKVREEASRSRGQVAEAFRGEALTEEQTNQLLSPYGALFDELRGAAGDALRKIHEALDERQRRILGEILESGRGWHRV